MELYTIEQLDPTWMGGRSEYWDKPARNVFGLVQAIELARVLRELMNRPTRVVRQEPPPPALPHRWQG
jgi:hypothetical protein